MRKVINLIQFFIKKKCTSLELTQEKWFTVQNFVGKVKFFLDKKSLYDGLWVQWRKIQTSICLRYLTRKSFIDKPISFRAFSCLKSLTTSIYLCLKSLVKQPCIIWRKKFGYPLILIFFLIFNEERSLFMTYI